jgi:5,10-methylene-tetrahydrofolate dehydrogenase/methenyl tetrahydrofolate cyclohydrolase
VAEDLVHLVDTELVVTGGDRSVSGEDALLADEIDVGFGRVLERFAGQVVFEQTDSEEGSVALVHVVDLGLTGESVKEGDAAEAEDGLLTEAVVGVAAVEVVGEAAIPGIVSFDVGIEQKDGDDVAGDAENIEAPGADEYLTALHG